jgi:protein-S-isoprenylcysteine O-methyltransferase Ste14
MSARALTFVVLQFFWGGLLAVTGSILPLSWLALPIVGGIAFAVWGGFSLPSGSFTASPEPRATTQLTARGPYRFVRHPMYSSALLVCAAWMLTNPVWWRIAIWLALLITLLTKLHYEERLLAARFPDYAAYQRKVKRLIPFVYSF